MAQVFVNGKQRFLNKIIRKEWITKCIIGIFEIPKHEVVTAFKNIKNLYISGQIGFFSMSVKQLITLAIESLKRFFSYALSVQK